MLYEVITLMAGFADRLAEQIDEGWIGVADDKITVNQANRCRDGIEELVDRLLPLQDLLVNQVYQ